MTLHDRAMAAPDLKLFTALYSQFGETVEEFSGNGKLKSMTVFAPNDAAIREFLNTSDISEEEFLAIPEMMDVLDFHTLKKKVTYSGLKNGTSLVPLLKAPATQDKLKVTLKEDGSAYIEGAYIVTPDIEASNGVLHIIDKVLMPVLEDDAGREPAWKTQYGQFKYGDDESPASSSAGIDYSKADDKATSGP